jgi:hypothetical protein
MGNVNRTVALVLAVAGIAGGRLARSSAADLRPKDGTEIPYAPTARAAPFVTLGYRELGADLLYVRLVGYVGGGDGDAATVASLAESITTLDPLFRRAYELGAVAATSAPHGVNNATRLRAIALLRKAGAIYPKVSKYPNLAGQIYMVDLATQDSAQRRAWDEQGALLLESAARKPGARAETALTAAFLQSRLGQRDRAIRNLREMLLVTTDMAARKDLVARLAELEHQDSEAIASEMLDARQAFERTWNRERPALPPTMYILVGARPAPGFDLGELATGGRDLIGTEGLERLDPPSAP